MRRAALAGFAVSYLVFIVGCMGTWGIVYELHDSQRISVHFLPLITGAGGFAAFLSHAIAVLVMYAGRVEGENG
jgi:hypothetical protein